MKWYEDKEFQEMFTELKTVCPNIANDFQLDDLVLCPDGSVRRIETITNMIFCRFIPNGKNRAGDLWFEPSKLVRLFSQEDLQEIYCKKKNVDWLFMETELWNFIDDLSDYSLTSESGSCGKVKVILAFVMHELYQKCWNPETLKWEKEE